ncbi:LytTR family DNA-binding domain-containing protein [Roseivirga sp. E12]|uniref:LytR/AlgR family response regulator transcription factor n=1 Tax=Roseivirga sp. E12 TaxID=2819237 RepID=UPI001ABCFF59|nr:LytTR family DNA-binding domain-containing protein [Roseivirga sp. E12]MBO3700525.1 response regulator transcription factor [Roseivirga sp. E12]
MENIKCVIVDDEPLAIEILQAYVEKAPWLDCIATFDSGIDAITFLNNNPVDLLFLDIQMPDLTGIQLAEHIKGKCDIVFTTAYHEYAIEGFELEAMDYLLKPISFDRFLRSAQRAQRQNEKPTLEATDYIFVKSEYKIKKIELADILYIEGMKDYLRIVTKQEKVMTLQSFSKLVPVLPPSKFVRVHKSFVIALDAIDSVEKSKIKVADQLIPISESYRETFFEIIQRKAV